MLHLIYFRGSDHAEAGHEGVGNLFYVKRELGKTEWSKPIQVNSKQDSVWRYDVIGRAQITLGKNGRVHVVWFNMDPPKYWYTRMKEDHTAFEKQRNLVTKFNQGVEAGASVAADEKGHVFVVWHAGDFSNEDKRAIYMTRSEDGGGHFTPEERVNPDETGVCACCGLKALMTRNDILYISYRSAGEKINRDMTLLKSIDRGLSFSGQTIHKWEFNACPVSITTMIESPEGEAMVAWETKGQIFIAPAEKLSEAAFPPGTATHRRKNPVVAKNKEGETLLVWGDGQGWKSGGELNWVLFDSKETLSSQKGQLKENIPDFSLPEAIVMPNGSFVVIY